MKKKFFFSLLLLLYCTAFAQKQKVMVDTNYAMPSFENKDAIIIDRNTINNIGIAIPSYGNFIRIYNCTFQNVEYEVFVHSPISSSWESLGKADLHCFDSYVECGYWYPKLKNYRYFAFVAKSDHDTKCQYKAEKRNGLLCLSVFPKGADVNKDPLPPIEDKPNAYVLSNRFLYGADENIRLYNMTSSSLITVIIFGWELKECKWMKICSLSAQAGQNAMFDAEDEKVSLKKIEYFAIYSTDGKEYNYRFRKEHDDWTIIVEDAQ